MTSLGNDCFVGTLHYKILDPPVSGGGNQNLQQTCDNGNVSNTGLILTPQSGNAQLRIDEDSIGTFSADDFKLLNSGIDRMEITSDPYVKFMNTSVDPYLTADGIGERLFFESSKPINISSTDEANIKIGYLSGGAQNKQNIAVGIRASNQSQEDNNIAIGTDSGNRQGIGNISIGGSSGSRQNSKNVAIGFSSGLDQNSGAIAIGDTAGSTQAENTIAIGLSSGLTQKPNSIAIGNKAGSGGTSGEDVIYIGQNAGRLGGRANSIYIGEAAGGQSSAGNQNSIVINASGTSTDDAGASTFVVKPIRGATNLSGGVANSLWYNTLTGEICYHIP